MSAGTRSSAITAHAPASSATRACSAVTTSMITPPLSISARPLLTRIVPVCCSMLPMLTASRLLGVVLLHVVAVLWLGLVLGLRLVLGLDPPDVRLPGGEIQPLPVVEVDH